ncbi:MAG: site-specific DNA-methyltransferase [Bacteroidales bacterium]|nr:site-specific DNA-methyltransferase [Bacteroidales bacterium]
MGEFLKDNWRETDLNVDSLWIISERGKSGKHTNVYHGNFIPQIPNQLIRRYSKEKDTVLELFSGSGTTLFECESLNRNYIGCDINKQILEFVEDKMNQCKRVEYCLCDCDVTDSVSFRKKVSSACAKIGVEKVDFMIAHPPYLDIIKFTNDKRDLSNISRIDIFLEQFVKAIGNGLDFLKKDCYFAIVAGDVYKQSEVVPLAFYMMNAIKTNFSVKMKGIVIKNIEGNRGKLGSHDIWKYRALQSDYFLFKHEYIFVFKKIN